MTRVRPAAFLPPALLGEGLAVHLSGAWQGRPVAAYARGLVDRGWIPLGDLLDTRDFRAHRDLAAYPIAGAFVEWMMATRGKDTLRTLYGRLSNRAPMADNRRALEDVLGMSLSAADAALRAWLEGGASSR